ncbi:MAG: DUF45 domain-containing protein [Actinomycetaceae bacterium]|nr:DUF45 domain-containing protein [Actinomycetaceae bacterium]
MTRKEVSSQLVISGRHVSVIRRRQKNMYLRVKSGNIVVTAPSRTSDRTITHFVEAKDRWIAHHLNQQKNQTKNTWNHVPLAAGHTVLIFGQPVTLRDLREAPSSPTSCDSHEGQLQWMLDGDHLYVRNLETVTERRMRTVLTEILTQAVNELRPHWEQTVKRQIKTLRIRPMVSRWGSCRQATAAVTLNLYLVHLDRRFLTYVLVHELTHLHVHGHGAEFYRLMDLYLPDWQALRRQLNQWNCR